MYKDTPGVYYTAEHKVEWSRCLQRLANFRSLPPPPTDSTRPRIFQSQDDIYHTYNNKYFIYYLHIAPTPPDLDFFKIATIYQNKIYHTMKHTLHILHRLPKKIKMLTNR